MSNGCVLEGAGVIKTWSVTTHATDFGCWWERLLGVICGHTCIHPRPSCAHFHSYTTAYISSTYLLK